MMIYKRAKAWEWSVGRGVWSGEKKKEKKKDRQGERKRDRSERKRLEEEGSCPAWKRDKPAPGKTRCECTLRLLVYVL